MKIILLKDIKGVGRKFEEKNVSDGYATNMLLPKKLAVAASGPGAKQVQELKKQEEAHKAQSEEKLQATLSQVAEKIIKLQMKANEQGHLFEKVTREKLAEAVGIEPSLITLEQPIKQIGTYEISAGKAKFTLEILPLD